MGVKFEGGGRAVGMCAYPGQLCVPGTSGWVRTWDMAVDLTRSLPVQIGLINVWQTRN